TYSHSPMQRPGPASSLPKLGGGLGGETPHPELGGDLPHSERGRSTPLPELDTRRFLFVTGKGGVGKTTGCAALATAFAARGKRVLIAMCNTKERLSAMLGTKPIGKHVAPAGEGIWAVNIEPELALEEYGQLVLKVKALTHAVFDNKYTKAFF